MNNESKKKKNTVAIKELAFAGVFTAVIAVCSQIVFPLPSGVPVTLQTFAVALCGYVLGWKRGLLSIGAYILLGALGAPVFSSFRAGIGMIFGVTGGFIIGFIPMVFFCGLSLKYKSRMTKLLQGAPGLVICHLAGTVQFGLVTGGGFLRSVAVVSLPFILKDIVSVAAAFFLAEQVKKRVRFFDCLQR
jgi:biotin transport system substrate-specific component